MFSTPAVRNLLMSFPQSVLPVLNFFSFGEEGVLPRKRVQHHWSVHSTSDYPPHSLSAIETIGTDFHSSVASDSQPRDGHPRLSDDIYLVSIVQLTAPLKWLPMSVKSVDDDAQVLSLSSPSASKTKVKDAHKKIMLLNHPDRGQFLALLCHSDQFSWQALLLSLERIKKGSSSSGKVWFHRQLGESRHCLWRH